MCGGTECPPGFDIFSPPATTVVAFFGGPSTVPFSGKHDRAVMIHCGSINTPLQLRSSPAISFTTDGISPPEATCDAVRGLSA